MTYVCTDLYLLKSVVFLEKFLVLLTDLPHFLQLFLLFARQDEICRLMGG